LRTLERIQTKDEPIILMMSECLKDEDPEVRKGAAKALGKVCAKRAKKIEAVIDGLKAVAADPDAEVRWKAEKALRILGAYDS
jgi:HEAT repeat protein